MKEIIIPEKHISTVESCIAAGGAIKLKFDKDGKIEESICETKLK